MLIFSHVQHSTTLTMNIFHQTKTTEPSPSNLASPYDCATSNNRPEQTGLLYFRTKDFLPSDDKVDVLPLVRDQQQLFAIKQFNRETFVNSGPYYGMPKKVIGMYILLADDTEPG